VLRRVVVSWLALVALSACADPPGMPKPLPVNFQEESHAVQVYDKYAPAIRQIPGVLTTYLTANNNPRQVVVVVQDDPTYVAVQKQFNNKLDDVPLVIRVQTKDTFNTDPGDVKQVPKVELPTTWWEGLLAQAPQGARSRSRASQTYCAPETTVMTTAAQ
jgi:hypothetical protein